MIRQPQFFEVDMPRNDGPAIHICRYPVERPRPVGREMVVPYPRRDSWAPGALALEALLLPEGFAGRRWPVLPKAVLGRSLSVLWAPDPDSPLLLPVGTLHERRVDLEWRADLLVTPKVVGIVADPESIAHVAWAVLCRADPLVAVAVLCRLSCIVDRYCIEPGFMAGVVNLMRAPDWVRATLVEAARCGNPILHPRGVRWVLQEIAAVSPEERAQRAAWRPDGLDDASLLGRAWFRCLRSGSAAGLDEILLATWMLHEVFHGANTGPEPTWDDLLSMTTALGYQFELGGAWMRTLDRWLSIWKIPDSHPAVADAPLRPQDLRVLHGKRLGVDVEGWLAGTWALCIRWWLSMGERHSVSSRPDELFSFPLDSGAIQLSGDFRGAFRKHMVQSLEAFGEAARGESGGGYTGLGSLPQHDSLACRNAPVLDLGPGHLVPISIQLVAERAVSLHRFSWGPQSREATCFGKMFEAYVAASLDRLRSRHRVVSEGEIAASVGSNSRCDALVVDGFDYLAIETSVQTLSRMVATGDVDAIYSMADRYQRKADQAVATLRQLPAVSSALNLPRSITTTHLVVTETAVPHSPAFLRILREMRPDRTAKFVCSVEDLDWLVDLGLVGWSVPQAIAAWQTKRADIPLSAHLWENGAYAGSQAQNGSCAW